MGDRAGLSAVRPWMLQCIGVADTRGEDWRFRGEQRAWSFTPPGVERNKASSVATWAGPRNPLNKSVVIWHSWAEEPDADRE